LWLWLYVPFESLTHSDIPRVLYGSDSVIMFFDVRFGDLRKIVPARTNAYLYTIRVYVRTVRARRKYNKTHCFVNRGKFSVCEIMDEYCSLLAYRIDLGYKNNLVRINLRPSYNINVSKRLEKWIIKTLWTFVYITAKK